MKGKMVKVLPQLINKMIAHLVLKEGNGPRAQLFLIFTDGTYYEFYGDSPIDGAAGLDPNGLAGALAYMPQHEVVLQC